MNKRSLLKRIFKIIIWAIGSLLGILLLVIMLIRLPYVQTKIVGAIEKNLKEKLNTELSVGGFYLNFPKTIELTDFYLEDQQQDTLVYFESLAVDADLWALTQSTVEVNTLELQHLAGRIHQNRNEDAFNYQFIIDAFSDGDTTTTSTESPWKFNVEQVAIGPVDFIFDDKKGGQFYQANWKSLIVDFDQLRFDTLQIILSRIDLEGASINIKLTDQSASPRSEPTPLSLPAIAIEEVNIKRSKLDFSNPDQHLQTEIGNLFVKAENMDLPNFTIPLEQLKLEESMIKFQILDNSTKANEEVATAEVQPWNINLDRLELQNNEVYIDLDTARRIPNQFDPNHFELKGISGKLNNSSYQGSSIATLIDNLSLTSDGNILQLHGDVSSSSSSTTVQDARIVINQSELNLEADISYPESDPFGPESQLQATIAPSTLYKEDLSYFVPVLYQFKGLDKLTIAMRTQGSLKQLQLSELDATVDNTHLFAQGKLISLADMDSFSFELDTLNLSTRKQMIENFLPDGIQPLPVELPDSLQLRANGKGSLEQFAGLINLASSYGNLALTVDSLSTTGNQPAYGLRLATKAFDFGKLLKQNDQFNAMRVNIHAKGKGFDLEGLNADIEGSLGNVQFNNYTFKDLILQANAENGTFDARAEIDDSNLKAELSANYRTTPDTKKHLVNLKLENANLEALNFSLTPLQIQGDFSADFSTSDYERFNGTAGIHKFKANNDLDTYRIDSLLVISVEEEQRSDITIQSDIMSGSYSGNVNLFAVGNALKQHINQYYTLSEGIDSTEVNEVNFEARLVLKNTDLITEILLPELSEFDPGELSASFNSSEDNLDIRFNIPHLTYSGINIDSFNVSTTSLKNQLETKLKLKHAYSSNIELSNLAVNLALANDMLKAGLSIKDSLDQYKYLIQGEFESVDSLYRFSLVSDSLLLAYEKWTVEQNKPFLIDPDGSRDDVKLNLSNNNQGISFQTSKNDSIFRINFSDFNLNTLGKALEKNKDFISGNLDGELGLFSPDENFGILADLTLNNLGLLGQKWGTFQLNTDYRYANTYEAVVNLRSARNTARLNVMYDFTDFDKLAIQADIQKFELETLAPLVEENITSLKGTLSGDLNIKGGLTSPKINGELRLRETEFNPVALNSKLHVADETVQFSNSKIMLNNFSILDELENTAKIDGSIELVNTAFYRLNLNVETRNFMVLNTTRTDSEMYYGQLRINGTGKISGTSARPTVQLDMALAENCELTYLVPETEYNVLNNENIVQFVNRAEEKMDKNMAVRSDSLAFQGIDLTATISITESSVFNVIIDPITEDQLRLQGESTLNLGINPKGDINLSGRYVVSQGNYNFSFYKLIKREFDIEQGSSITWSGDPYDARLDIRASNRVQAPPIDLMVSQIRNTTNTDLDKYKQRLPFLVILNIEGLLSKPQIFFKLDMPQDQRNAFGGQVYARIVDLNSRESELNKQVFALLLLQRFISENPLTSEAGYDMEDQARRSVSRLLSDQLNRLTNNIDGINLSVDLQSYQDYSDGTAQSTTQLELGVSKSLFNDQLEVKVSGNVNLEGQTQQNFSDYIGDLALEYKITEDGRLRITGFRRSDFDVVSGEITETGAGIIYVRDYNAFKELFKRREEK